LTQRNATQHAQDERCRDQKQSLTTASQRRGFGLTLRSSLHHGRTVGSAHAGKQALQTNPAEVGPLAWINESDMQSMNRDMQSMSRDMQSMNGDMQSMSRDMQSMSRDMQSMREDTRRM
jgi:hypothetical protein